MSSTKAKNEVLKGLILNQWRLVSLSAFGSVSRPFASTTLFEATKGKLFEGMMMDKKWPLPCVKMGMVFHH